MTLEDKVIKIAEKAVVESITKEITGYHSPLQEFVKEVLNNHESKFKEIIDGELTNLTDSKSFRKQLNVELNSKLAKTLINRLGGELESRVNELKSNPETRAKITIAISKIIDEL